jgi:hypothetical protein
VVKIKLPLGTIVLFNIFKNQFFKGGKQMIKGCKHYFSMFGMLISAVNAALNKFLNQICEQNRKSIPIRIELTHTQLQINLQKNQTYQG